MGTLEILSFVAAIITAPLSSWLTAKLLRKKYDAEVDALRAQVEAAKADTRGDELENVKKAMSILMERVVEPLKRKSMRYEKNWRDFAGPLKKRTAALLSVMLAFALCWASCAGPKRLKDMPANLPEPVVRERLVPVYLSPDSALLTALFECDSMGRVIMRQMEELKGERMKTGLSFKDGKLDYKAKTKPDTVYIPGKDSIIYVPREVTVEVNRLTWWQETWIRIGKMSLSILVFGLGLKGIQKLLKRKSI